MNKPIYMFTGFLDSGKTTSIKKTLEDPRFTENEKTLILCLEEGDEIYDEGFLNGTNSVIEYLDFESLNKDDIEKLDQKYNPDRIFIEFNGMDDDRELFKDGFPKGYEIAQIICTIDVTKFKLFVLNMPQFMFNHIAMSDMIVLHNFENADFKYLRNNIKSMNGNAVIILEDKDGNMYDLPISDIFDPNNLDISDDDYGLFYMDAIDNVKRYEDKELIFNGFCLEKNKDEYIFGRYAMVCCANDMRRLAIKVKDLKQDLQLNEYYKIKGIIRLKRIGQGIMLYVEGKEAIKIDKPEQEYVSFN